MITKKKSFYVIILIIAFCMLIGGIFAKGEDLRNISGILMGIGAGLIGMSGAKIYMINSEAKNPTLAKQNEIEFKDERNMQIRYRAKAKAADITQWLIMGIAYLTILVNAPLWVTLITVGVFLLYNVIEVYYMKKFNEEM